MLLEGAYCFENYGPQIFLAAFIARILSGFLHSSIYHYQLEEMGVPYLAHSTPLQGSVRTANDIILEQEVIYKTEMVTPVYHLNDLVKVNKGNYPVVDADGMLLGDISQCIIIKLISAKVYNIMPPLPLSHSILANVMISCPYHTVYSPM
uniref:CBS domain-containing protein n=1 Tax=Cacopsylla melanoneura TaxID=428564 RepID=A0A8D8Z245_9HEMI